MKKITLTIITCFALLSCNNVEKQKKIEREKAISDSIKHVEKIQEELKIANENKRIDSLSQIAWGDAKFGMSTKHAIKTDAFKEGSIYKEKGDPYQTIILYSGDTMIDGISNIQASFFNDRLYRIDMESSKKTANYWDTDIQNTTYRLKNLIEEKYGPPTQDNGFPEFHETRPDVYKNVYEWTIGEKQIIIKVGEVYSGSEYKVICVIYHSKESDAPREYRMKQLEEEEKKQSNGF
jgi:hypothetical protein